MGFKMCSTCKKVYNDSIGGCPTCSKSPSNKAPSSIAIPSIHSPHSSSSSSPSPLSRPLPPTPTPKTPPPVSSAISLPVHTLPIATLPTFTLPTATLSNSNSLPTLAPRTDMTFYRGEKSQWWPEPKNRLISGMTLYEPWAVKSMTERWEMLREKIRTEKDGGGTIDGYAQYLRATGRPFALATARTTTGSFTSDYNYKLEIKDLRTFYWGADFTLGAPAPFSDPKDVNTDYIVINADTIADATVLGFGQNTATREVTFLHDLPIQNVISWTDSGGKEYQISTYPIRTKASLSFEEKIKLQKLLR